MFRGWTTALSVTVDFQEYTSNSHYEEEIPIAQVAKYWHIVLSGGRESVLRIENGGWVFYPAICSKAACLHGVIMKNHKILNFDEIIGLYERLSPANSRMVRINSELKVTMPNTIAERIMESIRLSE
ncbi:hypothetical protein COZ71_10230, partial [Candidatus Desantisbacteria bacterium CG_4_8_14_3_um_filter_40_12]